MKKRNLPLILLVIIALAACKKGSQKPSISPAKTTDIYVIGNDQDNAVYWKNGKEVILNKTFGGTIFETATANAMLISNNNVYIVGQGTYANGVITALIWKNGVIDTLVHPGGISGLHINARALSIATDGDDLYIGGDYYNNTDVRAALIWKNYIPTVYGDTFESFSTIILSGADIYAAGCRETGNASLYPTYFKNGTFVSWPDNLFCWVHDIFLLDSNVYAIGSEFLTPCYWKNGMKKTLVGPGQTGEIIGGTASGKDVYFVGYGSNIINGDNVNRGVLWKNDTATFAGPNGTKFLKIAVNKNDNYIIGEMDSTINAQNIYYAAVWKNKVATRLSVNKSNACGIYIH